MTDYDYWKTDDGEKTRHPAPCSVCGEMFHADELNYIYDLPAGHTALCSKCESEQGEE